MSAPLVTFRGVGKRYGDVEAVKRLDLDIAPGEFVSIMGPSGCGKTTTLRMLAGLEAPSAGEIRIAGRVMNDVPAHERDTPLVWQSLALFPFLSVQQNVEFGLKMRGVAGRERARRARLWLERLGLQGFERRRVDQLSGGQRQRVALARSLVTEPRMLLLDEPLSALDAHLVVRMQGVLSRLQKELGITFVYVTHAQSEAFAMSDRVVIMDRGEIAQIGAPRAVYRAPRTRFVAEFVGRNNILSGVVRAGAVTVGDTRAPLPGAPDGPIDIVVAADRVSVSRDRPEGLSIAATFVSEEFAGASILLHFEGPDGEALKAQATDPQLEALAPAPGERLWLAWPAEAAHPIGAEEG